MDALPPRPAIRFDDGSKVVAWGQTSVHLLEQSATLATIELESGQAWFDLSASSTRLVEVRIADVRVHVLGTEFVVEEKQGAVFVWVQSGTARVSSNGEEVQLAANERGRFAAHDTTSNEGSAPPASSARAPSSHAATSALGSKSVTQLWSIADDARVEGNLDMAIDALDSLVAQYPDDARASLAAFTLGRVLLSAHKDPRDAARAFAQARTLAPRAPLAEDALSREIEALGLAGATREASERSALYERLFPQGRHTDRVRKQR
jgi:TolA-binding protein